jgi:glyoxylase-like metal-dependent hydrolase (beta-lactamase superfamily II)
MGVEQLHQDRWAKTYLVVDEGAGVASYVDPVWDTLEDDLALLESRGLRLLHAIATHTHADHITACFAMRERTGCDYVMWHSTASLGVNILVNGDDTLDVGAHSVRFHHAPGHTNDSMIVEVAGHIMTGDFLFTGDGGVGRDDLPSGRVEDHWDALSVLERFAGDVVVCTGHDPPGTTMQTLGWNRDSNPVLNMASLEEFASWQAETSVRLGGVSKIKKALPANIFAEIPEHVPWLD